MLPAKFLIAPMVGISHIGFRELVRSYTPRDFNFVSFTEMLSSRRLPNEKLQTTLELRYHEHEKNLVVQLLANEEKPIKESLQRIEAMQPIGIDINMGCPVSHTLKHNWGVRLMGDKNYAAQVVSFAKKYSKFPVSVKLRGGIGNSLDIDYLSDFTQALEDAGADWLTIHARPQAQKHKGQADWSIVDAVKKKRKIPVAANGNVQTFSDVVHLLKTTDVDGVMIARAATARPWILWQVMQELGMKTEDPEFLEKMPPMGPAEEGAEYLNACLRMLRYLKQYESDESIILEKFSFFVATGCRWLEFGHAFWKACNRCKDTTTLENEIISFKEKYQMNMFEKISLL